MSALTVPLADPGPLTWMAQALQARLQAIFPQSLFDFAIMPRNADRAWFKQYLRRAPAIALGWNGSVGAHDNGMPWSAEAHWTVALIVKNSAGVLQRYMGDAQGPGLFAMQRAATVLLHGYHINPDGTDWEAAGTVLVNAAGNLFNEEWGDENTAICGLDLTVKYEETQPPGLEANIPNAALLDAITWNFGEQPPLLTQTIQTGNG